MCRKMQQSSTFRIGDGLFYRYFSWFSSIGSHMGHQTNIQRSLILFCSYKKSLLQNKVLFRLIKDQYYITKSAMRRQTNADFLKSGKIAQPMNIDNCHFLSMVVE